MTALPKVLVGGPVRDREWSVPLWLGGLTALEYPPELLSLAVLVNDSRDRTLAACQAWGDIAAAGGFGRVAVEQTDFGTSADNNERRARDYLAFARARDAWVGQLRDEEWLLQVDSDIQVPADLLMQLLVLAQMYEVQMLAAVVDNSVGGTPAWFTNVLRLRDLSKPHPCPGEAYEHDPEVTAPGAAVRPCDLTGACVLLHRSIVDRGLRYCTAMGPNVSEDDSFCTQLRERGIQPYYTPLVRAMHHMKRPLFTSHLGTAWYARQAKYAQRMARIALREEDHHRG